MSKKIVANGEPAARVEKDEELHFTGAKDFVVTDVFSPRFNYTTVMNITESPDSDGGAFNLVSTGTRYSALNLGNENEIFLTTQNDTTGKMYLSRVQVYPQIKNIT
jgi:hypothetical protein